MHVHPSVRALLVGKVGGQSTDINRPAGISKPIGDWPEWWADYTHEPDGHGVDYKPEDRSGEDILDKELFTLCVQNGAEEAVDDVSGS